MNLVNVEDDIDVAMSLAYTLLQQRETKINISHVDMPSWHEHCHFVKNHPYKEWYIIRKTFSKHQHHDLGMIYLTPKNEVGIFILKQHHSKGHGTQALRLLKHGRTTKLYANISPDNYQSRMFFTEQFGAKIIQHTYEF